MTFPPSQIISEWVIQDLVDNSWRSLREVSLASLEKRLHKSSRSELEDTLETNIKYIAEHLRNGAATAVERGSVPVYEIDDEPSPYIRGKNIFHKSLLDKLYKISPTDFEEVCAMILRALGATSKKTQATHDGGVDFWGFNMNYVRKSLPVPIVSKVTIVGQAKRYGANNIISESELRKFVGGAMRKVNDHHERSDFGVLSPVIYAFWTTSDFNEGAREYSKAMGIWTMDGITLSTYINELGIEEDVERIFNTE